MIGHCESRLWRSEAPPKAGLRHPTDGGTPRNDRIR